MRIRPVIALICLVLHGGTAAAGAPVPPLAELVGGTVLTGRDPARGGYSALSLAGDGLALTVLGDRGTLFSGRLSRDAGGRITGARLGRGVALLDLDGRPLSKRRADAEGLAVAADGTLFISFEGLARVEARGTLSDPPLTLPPGPDFSRFPHNGGLESLALDSAGALYTIPEQYRLGDGTIPVYRFAGGRWEQVRSLPASGGFDPVDADIGPDGALYVLERRFRGVLGFSSRVRRFTPEGADPGETLLVTRSGQHDNLEGLSVWRAPDGDLRLTMISDNNFFPAQRSEIVEYRLRGGVVSSGPTQ